MQQEPAGPSLQLPKRRQRLTVLAVMLALPGALLCSGLPDSGAPSTRVDAVARLHLELRPRLSSESVSFRIGPWGLGERVQFSSSALTVESLRRVTFPLSDARYWLNGFPLATTESTGEIEEGDLLFLEVELEDGALHRQQTFRHRLEPSAELWLLALLESSNHWPEAPTAEGYLRAEPIAPERLAAIQRRGILTPRPLEDLPRALRRAAVLAIDNSRSFQAIDEPILLELRRAAQHGAELLVVSEGRGFTLTPFRSIPRRVDPSSGKEVPTQP